MRFMRVVMVFVSVLGGYTSGDRASIAMDALNQAYWDASGHYFRKNATPDSKRLDFWMTAHVWECVMDAYERHDDDAYRRQIDRAYDGFISANRDWSRNPYNDDIMWWTIACVRAYHITDNERYLKKARSEFDRVFAGEVDSELGGGMWWKSDSHRSKNACVNGPAAITAMELFFVLKDEAYANKARDLYAWERKVLFDPESGAVRDSFSNRRGRIRVGRGLFTYNQGTFIGAALRLYRWTGERGYLDDAILAGEFMRQRLCNSDGIIKSEGQGDGGTFKLIGMRYMVELAETTKRQGLFDWLRKNAEAVWTNRRAVDNIMGYDWSRQVTDSDRIECQSAAGGVVLLNILD